MILPDTGELAVTTELGRLTAAPGQLVVIPRGLRFAIATGGSVVRGYAGEVFGVHFGLPERGIVGANGLVDPRHVEYPRAAFVDDDAEHRLSLKVGGRLWEARRPGSPFDVVAWHGNYAPFRYDLANFSPVGAVAFDHPDPSIFSVFTAPLDRPGESTLDLVIFPPRWDVTENTFRPPFYHRNAATELNGILTGPSRDAVFSRGGAFLTPPMAGHGIAPAALERALAASDADADRPRRAGADGLWFQLESTLPMRLSSWALDSPALDPDFGAAPRKTPRRFRP